jgi:hypothetical protein
MGGGGNSGFGTATETVNLVVRESSDSDNGDESYAVQENAQAPAEETHFPAHVSVKGADEEAEKHNNDDGPDDKFSGLMHAQTIDRVRALGVLSLRAATTFL